MKITEYPEVTSLISDNVFLIDGPSGTKNIKASNLFFSMVDEIPNNVPLRRQLYRGKNLGSHITSEQYEQIKNGTFKGMFAGDFWNIIGYTFRIVDFDYWYNLGYPDDPNRLIHHLVLMPDQYFMDYEMEITDTTNNGYAGTEFRRSCIPALVLMLTQTGYIEEDHIYVHKEILSNSATNGNVDALINVDCKLEVPSEIMLTGKDTIRQQPTNPNNKLVYNDNQFAAFNANPELIRVGYNYWLRDVADKSYFSFVSAVGNIAANNASRKFYIRPYIGIKG